MLVFNHLQGRRLSPHRRSSMPVAVSATLFLKKVAKYCNDRPAECRLRLAMPSAVSLPRSSSMLSPDAPPSRSGCWRRRPRWPSRPTSISLSGHTAHTRTASAAVAIVGAGSLARSAHAPCGRRRRRRADRRVRVASGARLDQQGHVPAFRIDGALAVHVPLLQVGARSVRRNFETLLAA